MTRHKEVKPLVDKLMLAGFGSGCLLFAVGTLTKIPPLSVFGFLASTGAGSVSYVMRENTKTLLTKDKDEVMQQQITSMEPKMPLKDIFSDNFSFKIPNYQRPYAWTTEQTQTLLDDILNVMGDESIDINEMHPYFLGNIVLIKPNNKTESEVVDGQQRLTTLTILLSVLRYLGQKDDLTQYIVQQNIVQQTDFSPRLYLRERDHCFFERYIQNLDGIEKIKTNTSIKCSDSQQNIIDNTRILLKTIHQKLPTESQKQHFTDFLLQRCYLAVISIPAVDSAYRMFSALNDRGLDLSITDILKAEIIGDISQEFTNLQDQYTNKWEYLEQEIGRDDFIKFFSYIRMIYCKSQLQQTVIYEFRNHVLVKINNSRHLIDDVLEPFADAFSKIKTCNFMKDSKEVNQLLKWLQLIDHYEWIPPAILYLKKYGHQPQKILKFFTDLERLAAGLMILRINTKTRIKRYADILKEIEKDGDLYLSDSSLQLSILEQQDIINLLNGNLYEMPKVNIYVLLRLDTFISGGIPNYDGYTQITIEHVLPQTPQAHSQWMTDFPSKKIRNQYVHLLGNLVLLSRNKNAAALNYNFSVKKETYFNNPVTTFALTIKVLQEIEWTPDIIEKRQQLLLKELQKLWRLTMC